MFDRMALPPYLLFFIGISAAAPIQNVTEITSTEAISTAGSTAILQESTSQSSVTKGDQDVNLALSQALGNGNIYDQRQEGELNVHVRVDNATVYFVMLDGLGEFAWRKGTKGNIQAFLKQAGLKRSPLSRKTETIDPHPGAAASPQAVSASPPAAVSASTPPSPDATTGHSKPPRSTYIPPIEIKPESSQTIIEIGITEVTSIKPVEITTKQTQTTQLDPKQENEPTSTQPNETTKQQSEKLKRLATPIKSQARSEEQISILNLLKRTAALPPHNGSALRRQQPNSQPTSVTK